MQKIVIDTNVIVSALISEGYPSRIINDLIFEKKIIPCISDEVWMEYIEVLNRKKFSKYPLFKANAEIVLSRIHEMAQHFQPGIKLEVIKDHTDNKFLELAVSANADFLITGNSLDFNFEEFEKIKILSPSRYWQTYWS